MVLVYAYSSTSIAMSEAESRAEYIDPALKAVGWGVIDGSKVLRGYPISAGRLEGHGRHETVREVGQAEMIQWEITFRVLE